MCCIIYIDIQREVFMTSDNESEQLLYRQPMRVKEIMVYKNDYSYPICPRCNCTFEREYQSFCDRCGQKLSWKDFSKAKIRRS